jgi:hypothetical protein
MHEPDHHVVIVDPRPRESKFQRLVRLNLWMSAGALVGMIVWSYIVLVRTGEQIAPMASGGRLPPYEGNPGGFLIVILEVGCAWFFYLRGGREARGAAAFVGLYLFAGLFVVVGLVDPGEAPNLVVVGAILYAIASHLLYAIAGSNERLR